MSRIFLSHSSKDDFAAVGLRDWLSENGWDDVFLDLDPAQGIHPGERWERALHEQASHCEAVLFLVSASWLSSDWCRREHELARKLNKRIFVVLIEDIAIKDLPPFLTEAHQAVSLASGEDHQLRRITLPVTHEERHVSFSTEGLARLRAGLTKYCCPTLRDTRSSRQIALIDLPCMKNARRIFAIVSTTSIPTSASKNHWKPVWALCPGVPIECRSPQQGVLFARRFTLYLSNEHRFTALNDIDSDQYKPVPLAFTCHRGAEAVGSEAFGSIGARLAFAFTGGTLQRLRQKSAKGES